MDWVKPDFGDFLAPPKKRQKTDNSSAFKKEENQELPFQPNFSKLSKYSPKTKDELVVNKKKIEEVEYWLKNIDTESAYLLITGPPGCGKLKTLSVLCKSLKIDFIEWSSPASLPYDPDNHSLYKNELDIFEEFVLRACRYSNILFASSRRIVVVKDVPNGFLRDSPVFHLFLDKFFGLQNLKIAFIISDNVMCRSLFPEHIRKKYCIKNINFNPITQKSIATALNNLIKTFDISKINPRAECYSDEISVKCNGDLRNAITMLHFMLAKGKHFPLISPLHLKKKSRGKSKIPVALSNVNVIGDNKMDIFQGLGRVLYAKKENNKFVHDVQEIAESFSSCPNLFVGMLHENYLHTFSSIHDITAAATSLALSDLLLQDWNESSMLYGCGVSIAAQGVMISNSAPIKKFQQFNKSRVKRETILSEEKDILEAANPQWKGSDILLDIAPYASNIPYLEFEHRNVLKKLAHFS
ncbi:cell cycle checkpoint protein RAD17 [Halyomorpha halys]|uniref:cell cycle checkpoint protein RAD17 n=1 Tax=Halyomorpha halys TaxID=286706 RepID=UPI0006D4FCEF|nr:cell cycle checkpoint protein RAD17 [Halyomorpha halys]